MTPTRKTKRRYENMIADEITNEHNRFMDRKTSELHPLYHVSLDNIIIRTNSPLTKDDNIAFLPRLRFDIWFDYLTKTNFTELNQISTYCWTHMVARCITTLTDEKKRQLKKPILIAHYVLVKDSNWIYNFNNKISYYYSDAISITYKHLNPISRMIKIMDQLRSEQIVDIVHYVTNNTNNNYN